MNAMRQLLRLIAALLTLGVTAAPAWAWSPRADSTPQPRRETLWGLQRDDPAIAIGAIAVALLLFVFVAWIAARVGDKS